MSNSKSSSPTQNQSLKINIISYHNGVGLSRDITFLKKELTKLGHSVNFVDSWTPKPIPKADINLFVEHANRYFFDFADKNYFLPNPEWCFITPEIVLEFDMILCKTKETERIFKALNSPNVVFLGFTCEDRYDESVPKNYKAPFHLAGASDLKGTVPLIKTWLQNPQFPRLSLIKHLGKSIIVPPVSNIEFINYYLPDSNLKIIQNGKGLHICPSESEGFGYYIMEALCCGAVTVTTDAPPMNEFVLDPRCLVGYNRTEPAYFATKYFVDPQKLDDVISNLLNLPEEELKEIGRKNRELYLEKDRLFRQKFVEIFNADSFFKSQGKSESYSLPVVENQTVFLAILAHNKAHVLDHYLKCIHDLDYNKKLITVYINTFDNVDNTKEKLQEWMKQNGHLYHSVIFDERSDQQPFEEKSSLAFNKAFVAMRNQSLQKAKECNCDFYFVVDCYNFIAPHTLKDLVLKNKPIIAPYLRAIPEQNDLYTNFFYSADTNGFYNDHPMHYKILNRNQLGTFKVDVVHATYLIKSDYLDKLNYIDGTNDYEFIIFSRCARKNNVDQYICNEKKYGMLIHFHENLSLEEEKKRILSFLHFL